MPYNKLSCLFISMTLRKMYGLLVSLCMWGTWFICVIQKSPAEALLVSLRVRRMMRVCNTKITSWSTRKFQNKNNILFALSVIQSECTKIHCSTIDPCTCWVTNPLLSPRSAAACVTWFTLWCWGPLVLFSRWPSQEMHSALQPVAHTVVSITRRHKWKTHLKMILHVAASKQAHLGSSQSWKARPTSKMKMHCNRRSACKLQAYRWIWIMHASKKRKKESIHIMAAPWYSLAKWSEQQNAWCESELALALPRPFFSLFFVLSGVSSS